MKRNKYFLMATGIYLNFAVMGIVNIIISQYTDWFSNSWNTDVKGVSLVLSMVGVGRIVTILFAGIISDRIGRKKTIVIALVSNIIFLLGIGYASSLFSACVAALFFGVTNSFVDAGSYPAMTEAFPERAATMNSLLKAAMSIAQFAFPFWVASVQNARLTIIVVVAILVIDIILTLTSQFGPQGQEKEDNVNDTDHKIETNDREKPKMKIDGILLIAVSFTICFTFYVFSQYVPQFGSMVLGVSAAASKTLVSWYAISSMVSVFLTALIVTKIHPLIVTFVYTVISFVAILSMIFFPTLAVARIGSVLVGFFAAGGIWQLGLSVLTEYFPKGRGKITSYYSAMAAVTYFLGPLVSSVLIQNNAKSVIRVFTVMMIIALVSVIISYVLMHRQKKYDF